jgi:hypothetical protein
VFRNTFLEERKVDSSSPCLNSSFGSRFRMGQEICFAALFHVSGPTHNPFDISSLCFFPVYLCPMQHIKDIKFIMRPNLNRDRSSPMSVR